MIAKKIDKLYESLGYVPKAENQDLPKPPYTRWEDRETARDYGQLVLKAGWVKVEKEE